MSRVLIFESLVLEELVLSPEKLESRFRIRLHEETVERFMPWIGRGRGFDPR